MDAYADACDLLQQVMQGSTGDEDKRKLEAIVRLVLRIFDLNTDATSAQLTRTELVSCRLSILISRKPEKRLFRTER
jgi:hypothetical protein